MKGNKLSLWALPQNVFLFFKINFMQQFYPTHIDLSPLYDWGDIVVALLYT